MVRRVCLLAALLCLPSAACAQESVFIMLSPEAATKPSLKYHLYPERRDQEPGNAATLYNRTLAMFVENMALLKELREEYWYKWPSMPIDELPLKEVREKVGMTRNFVRELELAAKKRQCDWYLDGRPEGLGLLLPDLQGFRMFGNVLAVKARLAIAERNYPEAIHTLQVGMALGRRISEGGTLIHCLVGIAITNLMLNQVEELIQQPGAPNLYWTLAAIPRPMFDPRPALEEEGTMLERMWPNFKQLEEGPMSNLQVQAMQIGLRKKLDEFGLRDGGIEGAIEEGFWQVITYPAAKRFLVASGMKEKDVEAMPAWQAVALFAWREEQQAWAEALKWTVVPDGTRHPEFKKASRAYDAKLAQLDRLYFRGLLRGLGAGFPAVERVFYNCTRMERRVAGLMCLEAIRLYAASHDGKLPAKLEDIKEVAIPQDPMSNKPFQYSVKGEKATFASTPPPGGELIPSRDVFYLIHIRR